MVGELSVGLDWMTWWQFDIHRYGCLRGWFRISYSGGLLLDNGLPIVDSVAPLSRMERKRDCWDGFEGLIGGGCIVLFDPYNTSWDFGQHGCIVYIGRTWFCLGGALAILDLWVRIQSGGVETVVVIILWFREMKAIAVFKRTPAWELDSCLDLEVVTQDNRLCLMPLQVVLWFVGLR